MQKFEEFVNTQSGAEVKTLNNGATVIFEGNNNQLFGLTAGINVGSRNEPNDIKGVSHFLEHMLFNGTSSKSKDEIIESFEQRGSNINAFTNYQMTALKVRGNKENFFADLNDSLDILQQCVFGNDQIKKERSVILEEHDMYYDDPSFLVYHHLMKSTFEDTPYENFIIGTRDSIQNISKQDLQSYYDQYYTPENFTFSIVGDFSEVEKKRIIQIIERLENRNKQLLTESVTFESSNVNYDQVSKVSKDIQQAKVGLMYPLLEDSISFESDLKLSAIHRILSKGMSSILFQEIRENRGLCYGISSYHSFIGDVGYNVIQTSLNESKIDEYMNTMNEIWGNLESYITKERLEKGKNLTKNDFLTKNESTMKRSMMNLEKYMNFGELPSKKKYFQSLDKIFKLNNVNEYVNILSNIDNWNVVTITGE